MSEMTTSSVDAAEEHPASQFVRHVFTHCKKDKGFAARLRRADNPATEPHCWELLVQFHIDLESASRLPYVMIAADIARSKSEHSGSLSLGRAIAACYPDGKNSDPAKTRLRRLMGCDNIAELCRILRPILTLVHSRTGEPLNYTRILKQLIHFSSDSQQIKAQWAKEFYGPSKIGGAA